MMRDSRRARRPIEWIGRGSDAWFGLAAALLNAVEVIALVRLITGRSAGSHRILVASFAYSIFIVASSRCSGMPSATSSAPASCRRWRTFPGVDAGERLRVVVEAGGASAAKVGAVIGVSLVIWASLTHDVRPVEFAIWAPLIVGFMTFAVYLLWAFEGFVLSTLVEHGGRLAKGIARALRVER